MRLELAEELVRYETALPILPQLAHHLRYHNNLKGTRIGWHCHLTEITAAVAAVLVEAGAQLFLSECSPDTTCLPAVEYMRQLGITIYLGEQSCSRVLEHRPVLLCDTGFVLIQHYLSSRNERTGGHDADSPVSGGDGPERRNNADDFVFASSEITSSGITALRAAQLKGLVSIPVININGGRLKSQVENFHGVGDGVVDALAQLTGRMPAGRKAAVIGYGNVGAGVATHLKNSGCSVTVVERDPIQTLIAHYDGFLVDTLDNALAHCSLIVTATGSHSLIGAAQWQRALDQSLFLNVGHWSSELDLEALRGLSSETAMVNQHLQSFTLRESGRQVLLATNGSPANVSMLAGSPEPTLIHLTTEVLCMNRLAGLQHAAITLPQGEHSLPLEIEQQASVLALKALNILPGADIMCS